MRLILLTPEQISAYETILVPLIEKWLEETWGEWTVESTLEDLKSGNWQAWLVYDEEPVCIAITTITIFPNGKIIQIFGVAGEKVSKYLHLLVDIEDFGRQNGCKAVIGYGRLGWERLLKSHGYGKRYSVVGKEL